MVNVLAIFSGLKNVCELILAAWYFHQISNEFVISQSSLSLQVVRFLVTFKFKLRLFTHFCFWLNHLDLFWICIIKLQRFHIRISYVNGFLLSLRFLKKNRFIFGSLSFPCEFSWAFNIWILISLCDFLKGCCHYLRVFVDWSTTFLSISFRIQTPLCTWITVTVRPNLSILLLLALI